MKKIKENDEGVEVAENVKTTESEAKIKENEKRLAELTADLQRTRADFENYRKQIEAQKLAEKKLARFATVSKVLPLLDDIERGIAMYEELKPLGGILAKTMKELDLERISSDEGVDFNPDLHDAVMVEGDGEREVVAETLRPGYYYEGEILRPAMVKVKKI
ncbi:nucleotide exchange factor GrpE [Candidatus Saccharibacteria bacterium]|nr:nucleotide exchange factor GrpE [Candidatus Saccharibacteria bacterium]